ncbi:hypothetical protein JCM10908_003967 [Rhodotorula pacifica]|uniref:uncharacterized protein n=1 Tax=Rhodotorula pacifica TaxID=1495444 RepID=UPI00317894E9
MADASPGSAPTQEQGAADDPAAMTTGLAASAAPPPPSLPPSEAAPASNEANTTTKRKPVYAIFAPRSAPMSASSSTTSNSSNRDFKTHSATNGATASSSSSATATKRPRKATTTSKLKEDQDEGGSVLSLVDDSGDSDADEEDQVRVKEAVGKGKGKAAPASKIEKNKGTLKKGKEGAAPEKKRTRRRIAASTDEDDAATEDDDDDEVVFSETGSSSSLRAAAATGKGKAKTMGTATRATRSRRGTPSLGGGPFASTSSGSSAIARTASGSIILDLTASPPPKKKKIKATKAEKGSNALTGAASSLPMLGAGTAGGFAPLKEMYAATREKRKKQQEGVEARWPTAEEHVGGWAPVRSLTRAEDGGAAFQRFDKGKGREVHDGVGNEAEADPMTSYGGDDGGGFLARFASGLDFASASSSQPAPPSALASSSTTKFRPLASLPFLLPSPLPTHPLLDRLAAPFRSSGASASTFENQNQSRDSLWTAKYAPQDAEEVLGSTSRQSAGWLKEWLEELKVVGTGDPPANGKKRRRKVARGIDPTKKKKKKKKRRHDGLEDFMASSSDEEDDDDDRSDLASSPFGSDVDYSAAEDEDEDDLLLHGHGHAGISRPRASSASSSQPSVFPSLTNLILLQGPSGSGKSSTVHAVARQLGYEVFEVFPGFGRRAAKDLERYVGDAARNHVVNGGSPRKRGAGGGGMLAAMFGKQVQKKQQQQAATATANGGTASTSKDRHTPEPKSAREEQPDAGPTQSLILIDEVDVFFKHEEDCWAGIAALAMQSRRPIIMTCTDSAHVPFDTLNLQRVLPAAGHSPLSYLPFDAPEPDLATAFLSLVALNEGHVIPSTSLRKLYDSSTSRPYPAWMLQQQMGTSRRAGGGGHGARPLAPGTSTQPLVSRDLRKALMQLQVECQRGDDVTALTAAQEGKVVMCEGPVRALVREEDDEAMEAIPALTAPTEAVSLGRAAAAADSLSWADAYVDTRIELMQDDAETGRTSHPNDVEYSHPIVEYLSDPNSIRLPLIGHEREMANYLRSLAYRTWDGGLRFGEKEDEELEAKRAEYTSWFGMITQSGGDKAIVQPPSATLPSPLPILEIGPILRHLTRLDDQGERALLEATRAAVAEGDQNELDSLAMVASLGGAAAAIAAVASGPRAQIGPRRSTRQKIKQGGGRPVYVRRLPWASVAEADWLRGSGFADDA